VSVTTPAYLAVATDPLGGIGETSATLNGTLEDLGGASDVNVSFEWDEAGNGFQNATAGQTLTAPGSFSATLTGLAPGTTYEFRAVALADDGDTDRASGATFTTESGGAAPTIENYTVSEAGNPNPHAEIPAEWDVADTDADLESVAVEVFDESERRLDRQRTTVDGDMAAGTDDFVFKHTGSASFTVRLVVTDGTGTTTTQERTVTS